MSPIGQRHTPGDGFYSQQPGTEDNGNDTNNLCRSNSKTVDGTDIAIQNSDDTSDQQGSILEKALAKQDQALLTAQQSPLANNSSLEWPPSNGETQHLNLPKSQIGLQWHKEVGSVRPDTNKLICKSVNGHGIQIPHPNCAAT